MIEAEWLGGPNDGDILAIPDGQFVVKTPVFPEWSWVRENYEGPQEADIVVLDHPVRQRNGRWYILWSGRA